ncbi:transcriptional regulator [Luminiphilus syltensis NOR5-1B]|uniref:Transcriptional regulator n=1 Tax=Luminiphilus syltensis NOR5-1B TaxID=565045 RepID=B8KQR9_9GAMM|nr:cupin domain-containing protein [Luminiphilus syltensis]EED35150.1 transcriptional regulator [Luminiphilus syltensis NOR5-1B]
MSRSIADLINIAKSNASTERYPTPPEKCVKGAPIQEATTHFVADDKFYVGEWGAEAGCWRVTYTEHEYFRILSGHSVLRDHEGNAVDLRAGDEYCVPAGFEGEWEVIEPTRKTFVIYEP